jgi:hypothetical protein
MDIRPGVGEKSGNDKTVASVISFPAQAAHGQFVGWSEVCRDLARRRSAGGFHQ